MLSFALPVVVIVEAKTKPPKVVVPVPVLVNFKAPKGFVLVPMAAKVMPAFEFVPFSTMVNASPAPLMDEPKFTPTPLALASSKLILAAPKVTAPL